MNDMQIPPRSGSATADISRVMKLLPHRYPFLLVDRMYDMDRDESCVGVKNVTINEPFFQGHFPQYPGDARRADHRGPGADRRRAVRAQPGRGLQGRARVFHGDRQREVPQTGVARRPACTIMCARSATAAASGASTARPRSTARSWPKPRSAPCWPTPPKPGRLRARMADIDSSSDCHRRGRRRARRRRQDRPVLPGRAARSTLGDGVRARQPRRRRRPHHDRAAHPHLPVRLDRPSAAGPEVSRASRRR